MPEPPSPLLVSRERRLRTLDGVPGMLPEKRADADRTELKEAPELCRDRDMSPGVGDAEGARGRRTGEHDRCRAPEDLAFGGRCERDSGLAWTPG